jgi:hypothetical protein
LNIDLKAVDRLISDIQIEVHQNIGEINEKNTAAENEIRVENSALI